MRRSGTPGHLPIIAECCRLASTERNHLDVSPSRGASFHGNRHSARGHSALSRPLASEGRRLFLRGDRLKQRDPSSSKFRCRQQDGVVNRPFLVLLLLRCADG
jgi:hypothetical protein